MITDNYCDNCDGIDPASCIEDHPLCIFCGHPVDGMYEKEYRKRFPMKVHSRMSWGAQRDKDGRWYHIMPWQCILAEEIDKGNVTLEAT